MSHVKFMNEKLQLIISLLLNTYPILSMIFNTVVYLYNNNIIDDIYWVKKINICMLQIQIVRQEGTYILQSLAVR